MESAGPSAATVWVRRSAQDTRVFERALYGVLAQARVASGVLETLRLPGSLRPVHVPMRRIRGWFGVREDISSPALTYRRYEVDVCLAAGLPEPMVAALEDRPPIGLLSDGVPEGEGWLTRCAYEQQLSRATRRLRQWMEHEVATPSVAEPERGVEYFRAVWWSRVEAGGGLRLAVDATTGDVLYQHWETNRPVTRLRDADPWVAVLALLSLLLAGQLVVGSPEIAVVPGVDARAVTVVALALAVAQAALRRRDLGRLRVAAGAGDLATVRSLRAGLQRWRQTVSGVLLLIGLVVLVAAVGHHEVRWPRADPLPFIPASERGIDFETARPWRSVTLNFLQSPYGLNGSRYVVQWPPPRLAPRRVVPWAPPALGTGATRRVGSGGYASLGAAIEASGGGDRIVVAAGAYPGGRAVVRHDLLIEGEPGASVVWHDARGPFVEVSGIDTYLVVRHLHLDAANVNSNLIGDPNLAYGGDVGGVRPHVVLEDVSVTGATHVVALSTPGATLDVRGGRNGSISATNLARLTVSPFDGPNGRVPARFKAPSLLAPGIARITCAVCVTNTDEVDIDGAVIDAQSTIRFTGSVGLARIAAVAGDVRVELTSDEMEETGRLYLQEGQPVRFRLANGVINY